MERKRLFFMVDDLVFEVDKPEITLNQLREFDEKEVEYENPDKDQDEDLIYKNNWTDIL